MSDSNDQDMKNLIDKIQKQLEQITGRQATSNQKPTSCVTVPGCTTNDNSVFGGDPRNSFRELRRYLLMLGIDTRIFSFGTIPIPVAINESRKALPTLATDLGTLDNCFHFELRKIIEPGARGEKVNSLVLMVRIFFEGGQQNNNFWVQIVLNHHKDAVLELNRIYSSIVPNLTSNFWTQPTAGREGCRVTYFEKRFTDVSDFKHEFSDLYDDFKRDGLTGSYLEPHG